MSYGAVALETCADYRRGVCVRANCRFAHIMDDGSARGGYGYGYGSQSSQEARRGWHGPSEERWPAWTDESRAAWKAGQTGYQAAASASAEPPVLVLQHLLPQGQPQQSQPGVVQAAEPAQLPQSNAPSAMERGGIAAAAAAAAGQPISTDDLAIFYQWLARAAQAPAAGHHPHHSYPDVQQPGPAAYQPTMADAAAPPRAAPVTVQPVAAHQPSAQLPPASAAAQAVVGPTSAAVPLAHAGPSAATIPAAAGAVAQWAAAQPLCLRSAISADPWEAADPWARPSAQQPRPAVQHVAALPAAVQPAAVQPAALQSPASPPGIVALAAAPYVAQPVANAVLANAVSTDPWDLAYVAAVRALSQPSPGQCVASTPVPCAPVQQTAAELSGIRTQERRVRSEARRALQAEKLQDEWEKLEEFALLAQRVEAGGEAAIYDIARERSLEPGDVRKWHRAWAAVVAGPVAPSRY